MKYSAQKMYSAGLMFSLILAADSLHAAKGKKEGATLSEIKNFCSRVVTDISLKPNPSEVRGTIQVPLDYSHPRRSPMIKLRYRLIAGGESDFYKSSKPIAFVINGGPGYESSHYRTYGFREGVAEQPGERDSLSSLLKNFRVVLVDQRGTQGLSERLKMDQVRGDYHLVAKFFGSDVVARDMAKVIKGIIKPGEDYIIVGQSYGGRILSQLITGPWMATLPQPKGIVFSSSMMPHYPVGDDSMKERAIKQRELNLQLLKAVPDIKNKIGALKNHFKKLGLDPELVHHLFSMLGKGLDGEWEGALAKKVEELIEQSKEQVLGFLEKEMNHPEPLNYILSSVELTPGTTDRKAARHLLEVVPFEPWMISENKAVLLESQVPEFFVDLMNRVDADIPKPTPIPDLAELNKAMNRVPTLFTFADQDAYVPPELMVLAKKKYPPTLRVSYMMLPGGHRAIMSEPGVEALLKWRDAGQENP
jgi:pimeloyl-ACP methyl ester carboxylesterase